MYTNYAFGDIFYIPLCSFNFKTDFKIEIRKKSRYLKNVTKFTFVLSRNHFDVFHHKVLKFTASYAYHLPNSQAEFPVVSSVTISM